MIGEYLPKVTAFVTRQGTHGTELLLFKHPNAAIQLPAGTVEEDETYEQAAVREVAEETGLVNVRLAGLIGQRDEMWPRFTHVIQRATRVYSRPNRTSFDWAELRRGIGVRLERTQDGFAQVTYDEGDRYPDPSYISYQITGWVPEEMLASTNRRRFFHLELVGDAPEHWNQFSDNHLFHLFWAPLNDLPEIISLQREWLDFALVQCGYRF